MSAAEMLEAAARALSAYQFEGCEDHWEDQLGMASAVLNALPLPDEEGMVERVARALSAYQFEGREEYWEDQINMAAFVFRAINGGEP